MVNTSIIHRSVLGSHPLRNQPQHALCHCRSVYITRVFYKWNHKVYTSFLGGSVFFQSTIFLRFMHAVACVRDLFLFIAMSWVSHHINLPQFVYPVTYWWILTCVRWAVGNKAARSIRPQMFMCTCISLSPESGIVGSYVRGFYLLRNCYHLRWFAF